MEKFSLEELRFAARFPFTKTAKKILSSTSFQVTYDKMQFAKKRVLEDLFSSNVSVLITGDQELYEKYLVSEFLKDANEVNKATEEMLSEATSDMQIQAWVFAPLSAGIVVGLMAIIIYIFSFFGENLQEIQKFLGGGSIGEITTSSFSFLFNIGKQMPFHYFQIVVGIYMIEMVVMISYFLGELNYGDDEINKIFGLGKIMGIAILIYSFTVLSIYFGITSFIQIPEVLT
jgi:hypothetical protein